MISTKANNSTLATRLTIHQDGTFEIEGSLDHDGSTIGFYGNAPVSRPTYGTPSGTLTRTTFNSGTVTLPQLAERVAALITDLELVGLLA